MKDQMIRMWLGCFMLFSFPALQAQKTGFQMGVGGATYRMDDMKHLQEYIVNTYPVAGKIISSFPPYTTVNVNLFRMPLPHLKVGAGYAFTTTGGKVNYTDFSGSLSTYVVTSSYRLGAFVAYDFLPGDRLDLFLFGRLDANLSRVEISTYLQTSANSNSYTEKYRSLSPNGSAGLEMGYNFKNFSLGVEGGYLVDLPGDLESTEENQKFKDPIDHQKVLSADWTGWRASLKAHIWLGR
jgi:hypothetical protein